jgi:hypothetical protein
MGKEYFVKQGERFTKMARSVGFMVYRTIFANQDKAELNKKRPNPKVIYPDHKALIPKNERKAVESGTGQGQRLQLVENKTLFQLTLRDREQKPFAGVHYELRIAGEIFKGTTDTNGRLEHEIPAEAGSGGLALFSEVAGERKLIGMVLLKLRHLDPFEEITGVQSRLNNPGFGGGKMDGRVGEKTVGARRFLDSFP